MYMHKHSDGQFWSSLFFDLNEKKSIKSIKNHQIDYTSELFARQMLEISNMERFRYRPDDPCIQSACEHVALKFMICDSDLAKVLLSEEEFAKANELYARKQYNSKLLHNLLQDFFNLLLNLNSQMDLKQNLTNLFTISIIDEFQKVEEDKINHTFGTLKKIIDKVSSGVKNNCYYNAEHSHSINFNRLNDSLNQFLSVKLNYDFNQAYKYHTGNEMSTLFYNYEKQIDNHILQLALINDVDFWSKHKNFNVITFLNEILKLNDIRHAEKVVSFIADNLKQMQNIPLVLTNNFPLYMSKYDKLVEKLEDQAFRFAFKRLESYCDLSALNTVKLCYPMSQVNTSSLETGRDIWKQFIRKYNYPNEYKKVESYLSNEVNRFISGETHENNDIAVILDAAPFRYSADNEDRKLFTAYHHDCFSFENIWNRVYLKAYAVTLLSNNEQTQFSYLQRIFVDLIKAIEKRIGICTVHQLDTSTRENHFEKLKQKLSKYGINVNDEHKSDYIISLLDRDTALIEESESFPILEQIGDAIYGFAVAELLFYYPDTENMTEKFEYFTRAEAQVLISKKQGFDKLYLQIGLPAKYIEFDSMFFNYETLNEERLQSLNQEKYLADSLEMIIGSIYRDIGIEQAISFTKKLLLETFPNQLHEEVRPTEENKHNKNIDMDYWTRILPSPCSVMTNELHTLWNALDKVILTTSLGTDNKDKRRYITNSLGNTAIYGESYNFGSVTWVFHDYLNNGLIYVLDKYGTTIRDNYKIYK